MFDETSLRILQELSKKGFGSEPDQTKKGR